MCLNLNKSMDFIADVDNVSNELSLLIAANDSLSVSKLAGFAAELGYRIAAKVTDSEEALRSIHTDSPDLVLMDTEIFGQLNGFQFAKKIKYLAIPVLFVIGHKHKNDNKLKRRLSSINYIVKPIHKFSLRTAIELAMYTLKEANSPSIEDQAFSNQSFLFFKKKKTLQKVDIASIKYIQAADDYSVSYTEDGSFLSTLRLKDLEHLLENHGFFRIHRSYLLNLTAATSIDLKAHKVTIAGRIIPLSRRLKKELIRRLSLI